VGLVGGEDAGGCTDWKIDRSILSLLRTKERKKKKKEERGFVVIALARTSQSVGVKRHLKIKKWNKSASELGTLGLSPLFLV
jgi:hypothetical protein